MAGAPWLSDLFDDESWVTSSFSTGSGECVEIKHVHAAVGVRDSKHRAALLTFPPATWASFVSAAGVR